MERNQGQVPKALAQIHILTTLTGGRIAFRELMLWPQPTIFIRTMQLAASVAGYLFSFVRPTMAVVGKGVLWGNGEVTFLPRLEVGAFIREILHGHPVIFVWATGEPPFARFVRVLQIDRHAPSKSVFNGNDTLAVCASGETGPVLIHVGVTEAGRSSVRRQRDGLELARKGLGESPLLQIIPKPLVMCDSTAGTSFRRTFARGRCLDDSSADPDTFVPNLLRASEPLFEMYKATRRSDVLPEEEYLRRMDLSLTVSGFEQATTEGIRQIIEDVRAWLRTRKPGAVLVHGDYTLPNIIFDANGDVAAVTDWEWARTQGANGFDFMHLALWAASRQFNIGFTDLAARIVGSRMVPEQLSQYIGHVSNRIGMGDEDTIPLAKLAWLAVVFRTGIWTTPPTRGWLNDVTPSMFEAIRDTQ